MEKDLRGHKLNIVTRCRVDKILNENDPDKDGERSVCLLQVSEMSVLRHTKQCH